MYKVMQRRALGLNPLAILLRPVATSVQLSNNIHHTNPRCQQSKHTYTDVNNIFREQDFPFARARLGTFVQEEPKLGNQFKEDALLQSYLKRHMPSQVLSVVEPDLVRFGARVGSEMYVLSRQCEQEPPYLEKYSGWGKTIDRLVTSPAWKTMHDIAAEEGLIAISYERKHQEWSRVYGLVKNYLYASSSGLYSCPLAMTDGAAKITETLSESAPWLMDRAHSRLTSRDPAEFWTSGQWMTEKRGGSDVANGTETVAVEQSDGTFRLYGYKWFSSATDADMTFTLARVIDKQGNAVQGTKGLSLFYLEVKNEDGSLNNIEMIRLKNKLGTRQLPTAELLLDGSLAYKVSDEGRGVPAISNMLKLTRIHNAVAASSAMRRMLNLSRDYSTRRTAFGNTLNNYPLHMQTLARMEVEARGALILWLENSRLLGREDCDIATDSEQNLLRLLVPLSKLYSAKQALEVSTEGLESFGGQGYIEDTGLPTILRDAQVLSIWEGTTNILSLDVLRAIAKTEGQALTDYASDISRRMAAVNKEPLSQSASKVVTATEDVLTFFQENVGYPGTLTLAARDFAYSLCRTYTAALLIDHANSDVGSEQDIYVAQRWCDKNLSLVCTNHGRELYTQEAGLKDRQLVFDGYNG